MIAPSISELNLLLEQHLERLALGVCRPASFLGAVKAYGLAPTMPIPTPKGTTIPLHASAIFAARTKMLAAQDLGQERFCLSLRGAELIGAYQEWLTTSYTPRYRWLTTDTQRAWLSQIGLLVVVRYMMEEKCARFLTEGRQTFADPWVGSVMCHLRLYHRLPTDLAHLLKRIVETPEQWSLLITRFLAELDVQMQGHPFVQPEPLAPLPAGVSLPFVFPTPLKQNQDLHKQRTQDDGPVQTKGEA